MRTRIRSGPCQVAIAIGFLLAATGAIGCGGSESSPSDPGIPVVDASTDSKTDGAAGSKTDAAPDAVVEAAADAKPDALPEASPDAKPDALPDAEPDVVTPDAEPDVVGPDAEPDALTCLAGQTLCGTVCVDLTSDPAHCGDCATACQTGQVCLSSACASSCGPNLTDCSGACVSLESSVTNCGSCGNVCSLPNATPSCSAGTCTVAGCSAGFADCNTTASDGCEIATSQDPSNCGGCGAVCNLANATAGCAAGSCTIASCKPGFLDCNGNAADGCEVDLESDPQHCGTCATACAAGQVCNAGVCSTTCSQGLTNCNGSCVDLTADTSNCGACGTTCTADHGVPACVQSKCSVAACVSGWLDCNGLYADGCEVNVAVDEQNCGSCGSVCAPPHSVAECVASTCTIGTCAIGWDDCNGALADGCEVEIASDPANCGSCGTVCAPANAVPSCASGVCTIGSCSEGFADCNVSATDGCEVAIGTDLANCGGCGKACTLANATAMCSSGDCLIASCSPGSSDCNADPSDGCEVAIATDPSNCGGCNKVCSLTNATASCVDSQCAVASCVSGFADCNKTAADGCEKNTLTDPSNCGACGKVCDAGKVCSGGVCTLACPSGTTECSGACVSLSTDPLNCGSCGTICSLPNATSSCSSGACAIASCTAGFINCNGVAADGCEVNLLTDEANCGGCGAVCNLPQATEECVSGLCTISACSDGYGDCNKLAVDGCETSLLTDEQNCGACNAVCNLPNATSTCSAGACAILTCKPGFADCNGIAADGCEINILNNTQNCGSCSTVCDLANATEKCSSGVCAIASCSSGFADCNGNPTDGCEANLSSNVSNCGSCGTVCALPNATEACTSGQCTVASCDAGYADCNGLASDGCEENLLTSASNCGACGTACGAGLFCSHGTCSSSCGTGLTLCNGSCVDLKTDEANCGSCSFVCSLPNATPVCTAGVCLVGSCTGSWEDCNKVAADGCEVNSDTDVANCGSCGTACVLQNATPACSGGTCAIASCNSGYGDCNDLPADGCEANTATDVFNCGACDRACSSTNVASQSCAAGVCNSTCQLGWGNCTTPAAPNLDNGCELDVSAADKTCGSCLNNCSLQGSAGGLVCDGGQRPKNLCGCASNGACAAQGVTGTCDTATGLCSCGGTACRTSETCVKSGNTAVCACNGNTSCGANMTCCQTPAGCRDLKVDAANCGACGHTCPPGFSCVNGGCGCTSSASCNAGSAGTCGAGLCTCSGKQCAPGQRCLSNGTCG